MTKTSLIVPMAGRGKRFSSAGYDVYKPFLKICNQRIIDGVLHPFASIDEIFILTTKKIVSENIDEFNTLPSKIKIVFIDDHKLGPAYSIYLAKNKLPKDTAFYIAYCDVWWEPKIPLKVTEGCDAAIFVHYGFHPHLVEDNFSAFCKEDPNDTNKLLEIREKSSFTDDWMKEPVSIGVFYIRNGMNLFNLIDILIEQEQKIAGEYYPSMIFNMLIDKGVSVDLLEVESYTHIGVPSQFKDVEFWSNIVRNKEVQNLPRNTKLPWINCMMMGGLGSRMREISSLPKYLLEIDSLPMFVKVAMKFNSENTVFITEPNFDYQIEGLKNFKVIKLKYRTSSHLETLKNSIEYLPNENGIIITSCDCYATIELNEINKIISEEAPNCIVFSFNPSLMHHKKKFEHTSILVKKNQVIDVDIKSKRKNYNNKLAGFFWFKNKNIINRTIEYIDSNLNEELLVDHIIQTMVKQKIPVRAIQLNDYIHLGSPDEYLEYRYWSERGAKLIT